MARILIACSGLFSNLTSSLALAETLRDGGHDVSFAAPPSCLSGIAACGFDAVETSAPRLSVRARYLPRPGLVAFFGNRRGRMQQAVDQIRKDGIADALATTRPDLVLADCEHHSAVIQSAAAGIRVMVLSFMYFTPPGPAAPPLTSAIIPGRGLWGTPQGVRLSWAVLSIRKRLGMIYPRLRAAGADMPTAHRALARSLGFDLERYTTRRAFQMPWSYHLPTLFLVPECLDFGHAPVPGQHFAGPLLQRARREERPDKRLSGFFGAAAGTRRIYAGFGSMRSPPARFIAALLKVAARNPDWAFLIASRDTDMAARHDVPANVTITAWAPQFAALKTADCAIFHGGAGTLNECLLTATPMLIYPNALDGKGNGARVVFHGAGATGSYSDRADVIERRLKTLMTDRAVQDRLKQLRKDIIDRDPARMARDAVAQALSAPGSLSDHHRSPPS